MSVSVIIPAHNEQEWLDRTIQNINETARGEIEVCVVLNGYDQKVESEGKGVRVLRYRENLGERVGMNSAAHMARSTHLLRIDAHCDFSPEAWDIMLEEVTGEKDITVAVLTATDKQWKRIPGHWYGFCRLLKTADEQGRLGLEAKWEKPNKDKSSYQTIEPNMAFTGCGFMLRRDFYFQIGGADESLPKMGAIGEEFAIKAWAAGGKVQTRTDVMIGHIFDTGGYDTSGVHDARVALLEKYGDAYDAVKAKFPHFDTGIQLKSAAHKGPDIRTVIVNRTDTTETEDGEGKVIRRKVEYFKYVWLETEHPTEKALTEDQICEKYAPQAKLVSQQEYYADDKGELVEVA